MKAYHDSTYWYFEYIIGSGDCPAGCTKEDKYVYQISKTGVVQYFSTAMQHPNRDRNFHSKSVLHTQRYFTIKGQLIGKKLAVSKVAKGVYVGATNQTTSKKSTIVVLP
jgi:hypothetical protein